MKARVCLDGPFIDTWRKARFEESVKSICWPSETLRSRRVSAAAWRQRDVTSRRDTEHIDWWLNSSTDKSSHGGVGAPPAGRRTLTSTPRPRWGLVFGSMSMSCLQFGRSEVSTRPGTSSLKHVYTPRYHLLSIMGCRNVDGIYKVPVWVTASSLSWIFPTYFKKKS